jgi:predicted esterase
MERLRSRRAFAKAKVCVLVGLVGLLTGRKAHAEPFELGEAAGEPGVVVYPAVRPGVRGITVVLHGMCSEPVNACRHFARQVTENEHLVCPRASRRCDGGGSIWPQLGFVPQVERAVARAEQALGDRVDPAQGRTLIGYSLGAFRALELAQQGAGRYPRVMLIGAKIYPNHRRLRENGVERLLMSAGAWDMMHDHMRRETQRLARTGFSTRFLNLGPVGHFFTPSFADYLPEALRWLGGEPAAATHD